MSESNNINRVPAYARAARSLLRAEDEVFRHYRTFQSVIKDEEWMRRTRDGSLESTVVSTYAMRSLEWLFASNAPPDVQAFFKTLAWPLVKQQSTPESLRKIMAIDPGAPEEEDETPEVTDLTDDLDRLSTDAVIMPDTTLPSCKDLVSFVDAVNEDESSLLADLSAVATAAVPALGAILPTIRMAGKVVRHAGKLTGKRVVDGTLPSEVPSKKLKPPNRNTPDIRTFPKVTHSLGYDRAESGSMVGETEEVRAHDRFSEISNIWTLHAYGSCKVCDYVVRSAFPNVNGRLHHMKRRIVLYLHRCEELGIMDPRDMHARLSETHWARCADSPVGHAAIE